MHIQTNTSLHLHITTFTTRGTRQRPRSSRTTQRQPQTYQRSRRLSTGSQDSITRGVQSLQISDTPAAQTALPAPAPPLMPNSRRLQARRKQQPRECLPCAQCGSNPSTFKAGSDHGLTLHVVQKSGVQQLLPESVGQLRPLDRAACIAFDTIGSRRRRRCTFCGSDTPLRDLLVGNTFQDYRQPWHQDATPSGPPTVQQSPQSSQPVPPGDPSTTARFRTALFATFLTERHKQLLAELRRALPNCPIRNIVVTRSR